MATADMNGLPHVAVAGELALLKGREVAVSSWFCPATLTNLQANRHIAIVVWDRSTDTGYQVIGESEKIEDMVMMDGYTPSAKQEPLPQVERRIIVRALKVIDFTHALHTDAEGGR